MGLLSNRLGSVPIEIGSLINLRGLYLGSNQLSDIPPDVGKLTNLSILSLEDNRLNALPLEIGNLTNLTKLYLSFNILDGLPDQIWQLTKLIELNLSNNQLTSIGPGVGKLTALTSLFLQSNQLSSLPAEFVTLTNLTSLLLSHNRLQADDNNLATFLTTKDDDWQDTQTIAPSNLTVIDQSDSTLHLEWTPTIYISDGGYYEISYATSVDGPFTRHGITADKASQNYTIAGLHANTTYYIRIRTHTPSHSEHQNDLWSGFNRIVAKTGLTVPTPRPDGNYGMTWASSYDTDLQISYSSCSGQPLLNERDAKCNSIIGDTACTKSQPILCLQQDDSPRPAYDIPSVGGSMPDEFYHGWASGRIGATTSITGTLLTDLATANKICQEQLGSGYRMAEFHDGLWISGMDAQTYSDNTWPQRDALQWGGWSFYSYGQVPSDTRYWVYIDNQPANCWNPLSTATPTITATSTPMPTNTPLPSNTPSQVPTFTSTLTHTPIPTDTPFPIHTATDIIPTATRLPTDTLIPTAVPTSTPTRTPVSTATYTPIPSNTPTQLPASTPTTEVNGNSSDQEPNDSCDLAKSIAVDNMPQSYTFHKAGDIDWVYFDSVAGAEYRIEVTVADGSPADVAPELYPGCDTLPPEQRWSGTFGTGARMMHKAQQDGAVYLRLNNQPGNIYGERVTYQLSVRAMPTEPESRALIVVAGRSKWDDPLQYNIHTVTNRVIRVFSLQGYKDEDIYYLATDANLPGYDAPATIDNIRLAITEWARERLDDDGVLNLYIMDHGDPDKFYIDGTSNQILEPDQLDGWLTTLENAKPNLKVNIFLEACYIGSFIEGENSISKPGRVIITSSNDDWVAYASDSGAYFSDAFLSELHQGRDLLNSFTEARTQAINANAWQQPWLDANGNGIPNEIEDAAIH